MHNWAFQFSQWSSSAALWIKFFLANIVISLLGVSHVPISVGHNVQAVLRLENGGWKWMCHWHKAVLGLPKLKGNLKDVENSKMLRTWITFQEVRHFGGCLLRTALHKAITCLYFHCSPAKEGYTTHFSSTWLYVTLPSRGLLAANRSLLELLGSSSEVYLMQKKSSSITRYGSEMVQWSAGAEFLQDLLCQKHGSMTSPILLRLEVCNWIAPVIDPCFWHNDLMRRWNAGVELHWESCTSLRLQWGLHMANPQVDLPRWASNSCSY